MNWHGITAARYEGQQLPSMTLGRLLEEVFAEKGLANWREQYCMINAGYFLESLRRLLREGMGAHNWVELTTGCSWKEYLRGASGGRCRFHK